jgi:hypothetical protein
VAFQAKLFPGLMFVYFFFANRRAFWSMFAWSLALLACSLAVYGWHDHLRFLQLLPLSQRWYAHASNQSLFAPWSRLFMGTDFIPSTDPNFPPVQPLLHAPLLGRVGSLLSAAVVGGALVLLGRRVTASQPARDLFYTCTLFAMALMSPITWPATLLIVVPALLILWRTASGHWLLALAVLALWISPHVLMRRFHGGGAFGPWEVLTYMGLKTYSLLVLYGVSLWHLRREARQAVWAVQVESSEQAPQVAFTRKSPVGAFTD